MSPFSRLQAHEIKWLAFVVRATPRSSSTKKSRGVELIWYLIYVASVSVFCAHMCFCAFHMCLTNQLHMPCKQCFVATSEDACALYLLFLTALLWESFTLSFLTSFSLSWRRSLLHFCSLSRVLLWVRPDSLRLSFRSRNQPVALGWLQVFKGLNENETRGHIDTNILHSNIQTVMECHGVGWKDWCCLAQRKEVYKHYLRDCFLIRK